MATTDSVVNLSSVRKEFGETVAVNGIDFDLRQGEFFSLLGPSGCGKTTTLRMISGFETPTNGRIEIEGENVVSLPPNKRNTNLVFQNLSLFPHMSVAENVGYGLEKAGVDSAERERRIDDYLDIVGLSGYEDRNPTELSGGQQQRVAIARALVNEPDILLLDEPLSSLDRKLRQRMQVELQQIHERVDGTFFYVTHDQDVAMSMSDRLAVMNEGEIEQIGTPEEIYRRPASEFVADFIGDTNFLSGTVESSDPGPAFRIDGVDVSIPLSSPAVNGDAVASVRPEEVTLRPPGEGTVNGEVVDSHFHGNHTTYIVATDDESVPELEVVVQGESTVSTGDRVAVDFDGDSMEVFAE